MMYNRFIISKKEPALKIKAGFPLKFTELYLIN